MKNIKKRILTFLLILIIFVGFVPNASAKTNFLMKNSPKLYEVKEKEEVLVEDNKILDFYDETHEEIEKVIEEKKQEEIKKEEEKKRVQTELDIVSYAKQFIGNPYVMGGNSLIYGTDCSGFVMLIYGNYGVSLPRTTTGQAVSGYEVSIDEIEPGDIISYGYGGYPSHSALYIGDGMIVHASTPERGILTDSMYIMPIVTIRRVL